MEPSSESLTDVSLKAVRKEKSRRWAGCSLVLISVDQPVHEQGEESQKMTACVTRRSEPRRLTKDMMSSASNDRVSCGMPPQSNRKKNLPLRIRTVPTKLDCEVGFMGLRGASSGEYEANCLVALTEEGRGSCFKAFQGVNLDGSTSIQVRASTRSTCCIASMQPNLHFLSEDWSSELQLKRSSHR